MIKRIINLLLIVALVITFVAGCSKAEQAILLTEGLPKADEVSKDNDTEDEDIVLEDEVTVIDDGNQNQGTVNQGITVNQIQFSTVDFGTLSEQIVSEIEVLKLQRGYSYWLQEDGSYLIFISAGEKTTGGYEIEVVSMEDNEGKTIISVKETTADGDMAIQVMTYPYVLVQASQITDQFIVHDQNQEEYSRITFDDIEMCNGIKDLNQTVLRVDQSIIDYSKPVVAIYKGLIDNHTIEYLRTSIKHETNIK